MRTIAVSLAFLLCSALAAVASEAPKSDTPKPAAPAPAGAPVVVVTTSMGVMELELYPDRAPATVANFLAYADAGFYDGTIFHRVIPGFMIQGGGFSPAMAEKPTKGPIPNEAANGLKNDKGTIAMARRPQPDSATAQFFINVADNVFLNHRAPTPEAFGYCVFGKVTKGYEVAEAISKVATGRAGPYENVPSAPVVIQGVKRKEARQAP